MFRQIDTMIISLEDFPDNRISPLNTAHIAAVNLLPDSPEKTELQLQFNAASTAYNTGVTLKNIALSGRGEDIVLFNEQEKLVGKQITAIKRKVIEINDEKATLVFFNLSNIKYYSNGSQSDVQKRINELLIKMTERPEYITVLPYVQKLKTDLGGIFDIKSSQKTLVNKDKEDIDPLMQNLKEAYIYNKAVLSKMFRKDLTKIFSYFPLNMVL